MESAEPPSSKSCRVPSPSPTSIDYTHTWHPWQGRVHYFPTPVATVTETHTFKTCNTRPTKSRWIHTTGQKYGDEPRHFTPPRGRCDHSPAFLNSQAESAYVSICKHSHESLLRYLATTSFPHHGWWHVSLGNFKRVENERQAAGKISIGSEIRQWKHSTRSLLVLKCKYAPVTITRGLV